MADTQMTERRNAAIARGVGMTTQVYAERAENAELTASLFVTMFIVFGLFSIAVGILLIVLIFTMLAAIRYSVTLGCRHYYPGYACREPSIYDYKKNFAGAEAYDWRGRWRPLEDVEDEGRARRPPL